MATLSRKPEIHLVRYRAHAAQHHLSEAVRLGRAKIASLFAGIGTGKTCAGQEIARRAATQWCPGGRGMIVTPSYRTFEQVTLSEIRKFWPLEGVLWRYYAQEKRIEVYGGNGVSGFTSEILVRSAQNYRTVEEIRGPTIAWLWGDEVGTWHTGQSAFDLALGRMRQTERDAKLGAGAWGGWWPRAWLTGSPRWGWLNKVFRIRSGMPKEAWITGYYPRVDKRIEGLPPHASAYYVRAARTEDNRKNNAPGYAETLRAQYGEAYAEQELTGDFVSPTGAVFPELYPMVARLGSRHAMEAFARCPIKAGCVDWGFTNNSMIAFGVTHDDAVIVVRRHAQAKLGSDGMGAIARQWSQALGLGAWYVPDDDGDAIKMWQGRVPGVPGVPGTIVVMRYCGSVARGVGLLRNLMRQEDAARCPRPDGLSGRSTWLYISDECEDVLDNLVALHYGAVAEGQAIDEGKIEPHEATHDFDALRYGVDSVLSRIDYSGVRAPI